VLGQAGKRSINGLRVPSSPHGARVAGGLISSPQLKRVTVALRDLILYTLPLFGTKRKICRTSNVSQNFFSTEINKNKPKAKGERKLAWQK